MRGTQDAGPSLATAARLAGRILKELPKLRQEAMTEAAAEAAAAPPGQPRAGSLAYQDPDTLEWFTVTPVNALAAKKADDAGDVGKVLKTIAGALSDMIMPLHSPAKDEVDLQACWSNVEREARKQSTSLTHRVAYQFLVGLTKGESLPRAPTDAPTGEPTTAAGAAEGTPFAGASYREGDEEAAFTMPSEATKKRREQTEEVQQLAALTVVEIARRFRNERYSGVLQDAITNILGREPNKKGATGRLWNVLTTLRLARSRDRYWINVKKLVAETDVVDWSTMTKQHILTWGACAA